MSYSQLKELFFSAAEIQMYIWYLGAFATVLHVCNVGSETLGGKVPLHDNCE